MRTIYTNSDIKLLGNSIATLSSVEQEVLQESIKRSKAIACQAFKENF